MAREPRKVCETHQEDQATDQAKPGLGAKKPGCQCAGQCRTGHMDEQDRHHPRTQGSQATPPEGKGKKVEPMAKHYQRITRS